MTTHLYLQPNPDMDRMKELLKTDRAKVRVIVRNDPGKFYQHEIALFTKENSDDFTIVDKRNHMNMSSNNRMYFTEKEKTIYSYSKGKFWFIYKSRKTNIVKALCFYEIQNKAIKEYFLLRFPHLKFLTEVGCPTVSLNNIFKHKLFSKKDIMRYVYGVSYPIAELLDANYIDIRMFKEYKKHMINIENLTIELLRPSDLLRDSVKMANTLDKKINCKWSPKRLKEEHDAWAKEITHVVMEDSNRPLLIKPIFIEFQRLTGYKLIESTKDLAIEGLTQSHCVASYVSRVDDGSRAIFHIDGYTAEILQSLLFIDHPEPKERIQYKGVILGQFKGLRNKEAPDELKSIVKDQIKKFNEFQATTKGTRLLTSDSSVILSQNYLVDF